MSAPHGNVYQHPNSNVGTLGRAVRDLYNGNGWKISDLEFDTLRQHLNRHDYTLKDLETAIFEYVEHGGIYRPLYADLRDYLKMHRKRHTPIEKVNTAEYEYTDYGLEQIAKIRALVADVGKPVKKMPGEQFDKDEYARIEAKVDTRDKARHTKLRGQHNGR